MARALSSALLAGGCSAMLDGGGSRPDRLHASVSFGGAQNLSISVVGKTSGNMDASQAIWQFYQHHPLP